MQAYFKSFTQEHENIYFKYENDDEANNQIGSVGIFHLSKTSWSSLQEIYLRFLMLMQALTKLKRRVSTGLQRQIGMDYLLLISVQNY
jgi:hypothetical protein